MIGGRELLVGAPPALALTGAALAVVLPSVPLAVRGGGQPRGDR